VKAVVVVSMATVALATLLPGTFGSGTVAKPEDPYRVTAVCGLFHDSVNVMNYTEQKGTSTE
jgi:hypothetical protein